MTDTYEVSGEQIAENANCSGWLPIESAPKDGSRVLLAKFGYSIVDLKGDWDQKEWRLFFAVAGHWSDRFEKWSDGVDSLVTPTHWMPLHPPPEDV